MTKLLSYGNKTFTLTRYCLMIEIGAPPQEAAKSLGHHHTPFQYDEVIFGCAFLRSRDETPFRALTSLEMGTFGR
jgi:hypothetical protein